MGLSKIEVWDGDIIQDHNLPNQFYRPKDLNRQKSDALVDIIHEYNDVMIQAHEIPYNGQPVNGMVISAVDSIGARKFIWDQVQTQKKVKYYIDTRMGGNLMRIYTVDMKNFENCKFYSDTLKSSEDSLEEIRCTEKTILYNVLTISGIVSNLVTKMLKKETVPYEIIFDMKLMMFITRP
jgi:hypothetical protein